MFTNVSTKAVSTMSFGKLPELSQRVTPHISWNKLLGDIEALPMKDTHLGSLIQKDEMFQRTLGARKVRIQPENVREFFQYLTSTLHKKNPALDKRPAPERLNDLALFVRKVLCTIHKRKKMAEEAAIKIAGRWNVEGPLYFN